MKTRSILALTAVVGLAAAANGQATTSSTATYAFTWNEAPGGNSNNVLDPGESAIIHLTVSFSNQNTIGTYAPFPPGPGSGTIRGFGSGFIDLNGSATNGGNANGAWEVDPFAAIPYGPDLAWDLVGPPGWGTPASSGSNLINVQFGQFPVTPAQINATNPVVNIWTGHWTPASFAVARVVTFQSAAALPSGGIASSILFKTSAGVVGASAPSVLGNVQIPLSAVPAPASLALLGLGGLIVGRRRR